MELIANSLQWPSLIERGFVGRDLPTMRDIHTTPDLTTPIMVPELKNLEYHEYPTLVPESLINSVYNYNGSLAFEILRPPVGVTACNAQWDDGFLRIEVAGNDFYWIHTDRLSMRVSYPTLVAYFLGESPSPRVCKILGRDTIWPFAYQDTRPSAAIISNSYISNLSRTEIARHEEISPNWTFRRIMSSACEVYAMAIKTSLSRPSIYHDESIYIYVRHRLIRFCMSGACYSQVLDIINGNTDAVCDIVAVHEKPAPLLPSPAANATSSVDAATKEWLNRLLQDLDLSHLQHLSRSTPADILFQPPIETDTSIIDSADPNPPIEDTTSDLPSDSLQPEATSPLRMRELETRARFAMSSIPVYQSSRHSTISTSPSLSLSRQTPPPEQSANQPTTNFRSAVTSTKATDPTVALQPQAQSTKPRNTRIGLPPVIHIDMSKYLDDRSPVQSSQQTIAHTASNHKVSTQTIGTIPKSHESTTAHKSATQAPSARRIPTQLLSARGIQEFLANNKPLSTRSAPTETSTVRPSTTQPTSTLPKAHARAI